MDPVGGQVTFSDVPAVIGSIASYICDVGRFLQGNEQRTCQATGTWSGTDPVCGEFYFVVYVCLSLLLYACSF